MGNKNQFSEDFRNAKSNKSIPKDKKKVIGHSSTEDWLNAFDDELSMMGYRDDSPYRDRSSIDIHTPTGMIDMSQTGIPLMANGQYLPPYSGMHNMGTPYVKETPVAKYGGWLDNLPKAQDGLFNTLYAKLNPYNWGVPDYSGVTGKLDWSSAYAKARARGDKEFMHNNIRYAVKDKKQKENWETAEETNPDFFKNYALNYLKKIHPEDHEKRYKDLLNLHYRYGNPLVTIEKSGPGATGDYARPNFDYDNNQLHIYGVHQNPNITKIDTADLMNDYVQELLHARQLKDLGKERLIKHEEEDLKRNNVYYEPSTKKWINYDEKLYNDPKSIEGVHYTQGNALWDRLMSRDYHFEEYPGMAEEYRAQSLNDYKDKKFHPYEDQNKLRILQKALSEAGYDMSKSLKKDGTYDGIYGNETKAALLDYQSKNKKAYGGPIDKFGPGGKTGSPRQPRVITNPLEYVKAKQAYQDSLNLYNKSKIAIGSNGNSSKNTPIYVKTGVNAYEFMSPDYDFINQQLLDVSGKFDLNMNPNNNFPPPKVKQKIMPIAGIGIDEGNSMGGWYDIYKKPVQPVALQERQTLEQAPMLSAQITNNLPQMQVTNSHPMYMDMRGNYSPQSPTLYPYTEKQLLKMGYQKSRKDGGPFKSGGWLDKYQYAGPTKENAKAQALANLSKPFLSPNVVQSVLKKSDETIKDSKGNIISTPQSRETQNRQKYLAEHPDKYDVMRDYKKGISEPGIEYVPIIEAALLPATPAIRGIGTIGNLLIDAANPLGGLRNIEKGKVLSSALEKTETLPFKKLTVDQLKDMHGFLPRRQYIKQLQKEGLIGKEFNLGDVNYAARSTDKTNALTKLALDRKATRYRGVEGKVPENGIYQQRSHPYGTFDMTKPAYNNDISAFEHMKNAGVDLNDPISIAKYQASHIPMHKYEYRSGMPNMRNLDALYSGHAPTSYGNYQIKITSPRDYSEGNYIDWFKKYHNPKNNLQDLAVKDGYYITDFVPNTSYEMPVGLNSTDLSTVVGKRGQKMFDVDDTFPFMNYKKLNPKQELEFKDYVKGLEEDYNTGWRGKYKQGGSTGWLSKFE